MLYGRELNGHALLAEYTVTLALLFVVADKAANGCQRIVFKQGSSCFVQLVFLKKSDNFRDRSAYGTALNALWILTLKSTVGLVNTV